MNDLSEILNDTDPREPCDNLLDSDGDGLNNYFENSTGCSMILVSVVILLAMSGSRFGT